MRPHSNLVALVTVLALAVPASLAGTPWAQEQEQEQAREPSTREAGRQFTQWFYNDELDKLWERFSDEMKSAMDDDVDELAGVREQIRPLGAEVEVVDEQVVESDGFMVYLRTVRFANQEGRVRIQWAIEEDGEIGGFYIRPAQQ